MEKYYITGLRALEYSKRVITVQQRCDPWGIQITCKYTDYYKYLKYNYNLKCLSKSWDMWKLNINVVASGTKQWTKEMGSYKQLSSWGK